MPTQPIYLDHAAATPLDPRVLAAMQPFFADQFYNPSAQYLAARTARQAVDTARSRIAHWLGSRPSEITLAAGGTEANNLAIHGVMAAHPGANIVVSAVEHDAVLAPASRYDCRIAPVLPNGLVDLEALAKLIDQNTVMVSVMYANNEIGTIQPNRKIADLLADQRQQRRSLSDARPIYLHTDACQAAGYLDLHTARLGVDMLTINGGKLYGPKQTGALYVRAGVVLQPYIQGGGQERGLRSGTENVAGAVGLAMALDIVQSLRHEESTRLSKLQQHAYRLISQSLPVAVVNGSQRQRLPNNLHLTLPGQDNERLMMQLDEAGVQVAVGSACSASSEEPSHVLTAIGLSDADARASLRITMGQSTTESDIERCIQLLQQFSASSPAQ